MACQIYLGDVVRNFSESELKESKHQWLTELLLCVHFSLHLPISSRCRRNTGPIQFFFCFYSDFISIISLFYLVIKVIYKAASFISSELITSVVHVKIAFVLFLLCVTCDSLHNIPAIESWEKIKTHSCIQSVKTRVRFAAGWRPLCVTYPV